METTAKKAIGTGAPLMSTSTRAGSVMIAAITAVMMTAFAGTRREFTADHNRCPGTARSRLKANSIREALVWQAVVQNNCPAVEMNSTAAAHLDVSAWLKIDATPPPAADTPSASCTANRKDSRRIQPPIAE